jgi:hypothetical protein
MNVLRGLRLRRRLQPQCPMQALQVGADPAKGGATGKV